ncbi:MAG: MFS transporter [Ignavibacteria bacterium GWB2_35_12]|nr:MAG: MFS transporter [Ignavibacteria bacterium GWA2_35_8]OGU39808.1 MAG: MFS transporter [Ignavibacteria bacterium GWB2_35_12]OGU95152.1 MAG: MFS transporter [Ignavibacteria bacterium RIFOXYA2_FULL_35_10]OGV21438.1 MAG: MFS transporter [Ignavibacteria bacterium RIFOXYC2_FULL_35_21]
MSDSQLSTRKERIGWYFYDWANSVFYTTVITVFLGPYLTSITKAGADAHGFVHILGVPVHSGSFFPYVVSASVLLQVLVLPLLGAIADYTHKKKFMLGLFAYIGSISTMGLFFLHGTNYLLGALFFIIANISFGASAVMYNAYLNDIAETDRRDAVSSIGWAFGYLGGGVLLALNLALYLNASKLGLTSEMAIRLNLVSAGIWWALFTIIPMLTLKIRQSAKQKQTGERLISIGFKELFATIKGSFNYPKTLIFLIAYLLYNDGVQSVIAISAVFGQEELGLSMSTLTTVILMVQFMAFFGALLFNYIANSIGTKRALLISLVIWTGCVFYSFQYLSSETGFYILGGVIAIVLGATQSLSRSMFSHLIPKNKEAEYFSLYEISDKGTSWIGPLAFGLALQFSGSYRWAILSLALFFIVGFVMLLVLKIKEGIKEVGNEIPQKI